MKDNEQKMIDSMVLTCKHVIEGNAKYEYVPENKKLGATESFTCSDCLDLNAIEQNETMKFLIVVHKDCFISNRISRRNNQMVSKN